MYFGAPKNRVEGGMRGEEGVRDRQTNKNYKSCERKRSVTRGERKVVKNQINIQKRRKKNYKEKKGISYHRCMMHIWIYVRMRDKKK